ncbi:MAG: DUF2798 domain-containing protein [Glaciimonas sp.]|nr:DUF2798 domain-containing protein [Glaciimonas sp.]
MPNDTSACNNPMAPAAAYYLNCTPVATYTRASTARKALRRSNSLASMLPSLLMTGLLTLVMSAVLRLVWVGFSPDFTAAWMEAWLTSWPIVFSFAYLLSAPVSRLAALIAAPALTLDAGRDASLSLAHIADASANATAINGLSVQRQGHTGV